MVVNPNLPVSIDLEANPSGPICQGTSVTFIATPTNGGTSPEYQWTLNGIIIPDVTSNHYTSSILVMAIK